MWFFIGDDCGDDPFICDDSVKGKDGTCIDWFSEDNGSVNGFAPPLSEGFCPDISGESETFCAQLPSLSDPGTCVVLPGSANGFCDDIAGTLMQVNTRFVGASSTVKAWRAICAKRDQLRNR